MPELPEVETVRRQLAAELPGRRILEVVQADPFMLRGATAEELATAVTGRRILDVGRRGKFLLLALDREHFLTVHLGMTGQLLLRPAARAGQTEPGSAAGGASPHDRFVFAVSGTRGRRRAQLVFRDMRKFGRVEVGVGAPAERVGRMGPDAWPGQDWDVAYLASTLAGKRAPLKAFLLDQRRIAGIGNIYADEILFGAGLSPLRPAGSLDEDETRRLAGEIVARLDEGVRLRGCSISDFVDTEGGEGGFQHVLRAYGRHGMPCARCGSTLVRAMVAGRGTAYCPRCQR